MNTWFWEKLQPKGSSFPTSREGHSFIYNSCNRDWILFGGISSLRTSEALSLDSATGEWKNISKSKGPLERAYHISWLEPVLNRLYIFGGQGAKREPMYDMHTLCIDTGKWMKLGPLERPSGRIHSAGCLLKPCLYMFGGASAPSDMLNNDFWSFPYEEINWTVAEKDGNCPGWIQHPLTNAPEKRKGHTMIGYINTIYIFGGFDGASYLNDLFCLSPPNTQCCYPHTFGQSPCPRAYHSATVTSNGKMIVFAGKCVNEKNISELLCDVYILDLIDLYWSSPFIAGFYPTPRYSSGIAYGLNSQNIEQILILGGIGKNYAGMDLFHLVEKEVDSSAQWFLDDVQSGKLKQQAGTESTLLSNRRKIRDLEGQIIMLQEKCSFVDDDIYLIKGKLEVEDHEKMRMKSLYKEISRKLKKEIKENEKSKKKEAEKLKIRARRIKNYENRVESLGKILKDTESFLVTLDSIFCETISNNIRDDFRTFSQDRIDEIEERKKNHLNALLLLRQWYEGSIALENSISSALDSCRL